METFDLESHLRDAYSGFPEAKHQPIIGLTANYEGIDATLRDCYYKQVIAAGGTPVIIPPVADSALSVIVKWLSRMQPLPSVFLDCRSLCMKMAAESTMGLLLPSVVA